MYEDEMKLMGVPQEQVEWLTSNQGVAFIDHIYMLGFDEGYDNGVCWCIQDWTNHEEYERDIENGKE